MQSQTELAEQLAIAEQPLGKIIDKLEQEGWLVRKKNQDDKRQKLVSVTKKIQPFIKPLSEVVDGIDKLALISLPPNDQTILMDTLLQIRAHLKSDLA